MVYWFLVHDQDVQNCVTVIITTAGLFKPVADKRIGVEEGFLDSTGFVMGWQWSTLYHDKIMYFMNGFGRNVRLDEAFWDSSQEVLSWSLFISGHNQYLVLFCFDYGIEKEVHNINTPRLRTDNVYTYFTYMSGKEFCSYSVDVAMV